MSGYDLKQKLSKHSPFHWSESNAQIYPILKKLEAEGKISSRLDEESGARNRRLYLITSDGLAHLESWLKEPAETTQQREELLLKLAMAEHLEKSEIMQHLYEFQSQLLVQKRILEQTKRNIQKHHQKKADYVYLQAVCEYTECIVQGKQSWAQKLLETLKSLDEVE